MRRRKRGSARSCARVTEKFAERQKQRRMLERGWELNMNFLSGNQYVGITPAGELEEEQPRYYWQCREVFNHIAPAIDTRCAKLAQVRPVMSVRAATGEEGDMRTAKISSNVLRSVLEECSFDETMARAAVWSETCGTSFYKVLWDASRAGRGRRRLHRGGAALRDLSRRPFLRTCGRPAQHHPRAGDARRGDLRAVRHKSRAGKGGVPARTLCGGVEFRGRAGQGRALPVREDCALVIEYYEKPTRAYPKGRFLAVAGGRLAYEGELPYCNGEAGERSYPFAKQCALEFSGAFFGGSIIDRMIPVQRAFNAVKNRKHEFLNRLTAGVLAVEDGSVDTEELIEEGLPPGKVLVYRQGAPAPKMLAPRFAALRISAGRRAPARRVHPRQRRQRALRPRRRTRHARHRGATTAAAASSSSDDTRLAVTTDSPFDSAVKTVRQAG